MAMSSCKLTLTGKLEAFDSLSFNPKKKKHGPILADAGTYSATLSFKSKKKIYLKFKDGKKKKVLFRIPKGKKLPRTSGAFTLLSSESGQPYDLEGEIDTSFSSGPQTTSTESCSETYYRRVCRRNEEGKRECYREAYTEYGTRQVTGHYEYTEKALSSILKDKNSGAVVGQFNGTHHDSTFSVDYYGGCRIRF